MKYAVVIPARLESTRLPRKMLLDKTGKPLIIHTCERATKALHGTPVYVATDSEEIQQVVLSAGFNCIMTSPDHQSGLDRVSEASKSINASIIINVQGDEPEINPDHIDLVGKTLTDNHWAYASTLCTPGNYSDDQIYPDSVKVILGESKRALYFTRAPAVWDRDKAAVSSNCYRHIGIYAYRKHFLNLITQMPCSPLEKVEKLEQLRILDGGFDIACEVVESSPSGIDTQKDYDEFVKRHVI